MKEYKLIKFYPSLPTEWYESEFPIIVVERDNDEYHLHPSLYGFATQRVFPRKEVENNEEFWEDISPKEYEIIEFHKGNNKIISVKRISDEEVFTVGEYVNFGDGDICKISSLRGHSGDDSNFWAFYNDKKGYGSNIFSIKKLKQPLFTTVDGVEIFKNRPYYGVRTDDFGLECHEEGINFDLEEGETWADKTYLTFYTKEKAEEWIIENKPCVSYKDVIGLVGGSIVDMDLRALIKSRL